MKRIAILTSGEAPASMAMMEKVNKGNRYRVGVVPNEVIAQGTAVMIDALRKENIDLVIVEEYDEELPADFPIPVMYVAEGETESECLERLKTVCPEFGPERHWAETLGESFDENRVTPPPAPEQLSEPIPGSVPPGPVPHGASPSGAFPPGSTPPGAFLQDAMADPQRVERPAMPDNYLLWSILATILCSFIPGIVAIIFSSMVSSRYYAGNYEGSVKASETAQIWIIVSIVLSCVINSLYVPLMLMGGLFQ